MTMSNRVCLAALAVILTACVDTSEKAPTAIGAIGNGGLPQRLWDRYVLHDIQTNVLPAQIADSGIVRLRIYADTLRFNLATGDFRETAVVCRFDANGSEVIGTVTSPPRSTYTRGVADAIVFTSVIFGSSTATLSGATRIQPFSTTLRIGSSAASYSISF
jgi:hypothetical protein